MKSSTQTHAQRRQATQKEHHAGRRHEPSHAEIERRAYELYRERNGQDGSEVLDWLGAEQELRAANQGRSFAREEDV